MVSDKVITHLQSNSDLYVKRLREWVAIQSVSAYPNLRPEVIKMVHFVKDELDKLGAKTELKDVGMEDLPDGSGQISLPPVLLAQIGEKDPKKHTVCIYGHLDVIPAEKKDGWNSEPFQLTIDNQDRMFARGATDDKGPVLGWLNVIEAYQQSKEEIPVNLKLIFEGMEESGSRGMSELLQREKSGFFKDVDYVCISDNYWTGKTKPCITYGLRGLAYFIVSVQCASRDLHSGSFGGVVSEAMVDLVKIMASLVDSQGRISVPGLDQMVAPLTKDEQELYSKLDFDVDDFCKDIGVVKLTQSSKEMALMHRWRYPSLSLHGIEGAFDGPGTKTVIPKKVMGKFSIRLVPNMEVDKVQRLVKDYIQSQFSRLNSPNKLDIQMGHDSSAAWIEDVNHPHYEAAKRACREVFGVEPDLTREGGTIGVALAFSDILKKNLLLLPIGACDDGAHSQNEKLDKRNYFKGMELLATYLNEVAKIEKK